MNNKNLEFSEFKKIFTLRIQNNLEDVFNSYGSSSCDLLKPMKYTALNGSKFIRSLLVYSSGSALKIPFKLLDQVSIAIELIHTYTLIHDDLPCMDDDDYRRGRLSTHKKYDEGQAILAGNSLLTMAFNLLAQDSNSSLVELLSLLSGHEGLAGGQSLDIDNTKKKLNYKLINKIHEQKTARLFEFCLAAPFIISNKSRQEINMSRKYGKIIGTIFQIIDDVHDYENKNNEYINILNIMTKDDALKKCSTYEAEANSLREKLIPNKKNRMNDILSYIINRK